MNHDLFKKHPMDTTSPSAAHSTTSSREGLIQSTIGNIKMASVQAQASQASQAQIQAHAQAQATALVAAKKQTLLDLFQRTDPLVCDIIDGRKFAVLYKIAANQRGTPKWEDGNASGHLFLVQRTEDPLFQISILQVDSATSEKKVEFTDYMSLDWDIDTQEHYVFYRNVNREDMSQKGEPVRGLWFKDESDRVAFHSVLTRAFEELVRIQHHKNNPSTPPPPYVNHTRSLSGQMTPEPTQVPMTHLYGKQMHRMDEAHEPKQLQQTEVKELCSLFGIPSDTDTNIRKAASEGHGEMLEHLGHLGHVLQRANIESQSTDMGAQQGEKRIAIRKRQLPRLLGIAIQQMLANVGPQDQVMDAIWNQANNEFSK